MRSEIHLNKTVVEVVIINNIVSTLRSKLLPVTGPYCASPHGKEAFSIALV